MINIPTEIQTSLLTDKTQLLLLVALIIIAAWTGKWYWQKRRFFKMAASIPGPKGAPFYGVAVEFFLSAKEGTFAVLIKHISHNSHLFKIWLGNVLYIFLARPEYFEAVLKNKDCLAKNLSYDFMKPYVGNGLLCAPVEIWKKNRKLLNPTFHQIILNTFVPIFNENVAILMEALERSADDPDFHIFEHLSACTLDTIIQTAMGLKANTQIDTKRFGKLLERAQELATLRMFNVVYQNQIIFGLVYGNIWKKLIAALSAYSRKVFKEQKEIFQQKMKSIENGTYVETEKSKRNTFLNLLLEVSYNGGQLSDQQIQDEVNTVIVGGSDTSAASMAFCTLLLAMYPEYQQKVYEEALEVLGPDRDITAEDIPKLKFLDMCLKENLRLFPVVPLIARVAMEDMKIANYVVPKDTTLVLSIFNMHRNPEFWKDPLVFNPYRFLPEEFAKLDPFVFMPFSSGQRNCLDPKYAYMVMKSVLTRIIRRFELKTKYKSIQEVNVMMSMLLKPVDGFKVSLHRRN